MQMNSVDRTITKYYLQWVGNPEPLPFQPIMLLSELIPHLLVSLRLLNPYIHE